MTMEQALKLRTGGKKKIIITAHENLIEEVDRYIKKYPRSQFIEDALWYYLIKCKLEDEDDRNKNE